MKRFTKITTVILIVAIIPISTSSPLLNQETTVIIGTTDSIRNLDPSDAYNYFSSNIILQITHGLMEMPIDSMDAVKGPIVDYFTVSSDAMVYSFGLKADIKFSDGEAFDATAMKWLLDRSITLGGDPGFLLADVVDTVVADGQTLTINLSTPDATFLQRLAYTVAWPISPKSLSSTSIEGDPDSIPAGLGPYMVTKWTKGTELILEPNPNYFGEAPKTDKVVIKFYTSASALLVALESGEIDVAHKKFGPDEIEAVVDNADLVSVDKATAGIRYLIFDVVLHDDVRVRDAIAKSIDRSAITATVYNDLNSPLLTMVPSIFSSSIDVYEDGPNQATVATLMEAAGYDNDTNKYTMDFWYTPTHYGYEEKDTAELLATQFEATGYFHITVKSTEWSAYLDSRGDMGLFLLGWWFDYPDPTNYIDPWAGAGAESMGTDYNSTEMNGYLNTMFTDPDAADRAQASKDAQQLMADDVMAIPLYSMVKQFSGLQTNVEGFNLEPSENVHYNSIYIIRSTRTVSVSSTTSNLPTDQDSIITDPTSEINLPFGTYITTFFTLFVSTFVLRKQVRRN